MLPASIALWPGPRTYTGGPLAEIHTVGSPPLLDLLLAHCLTRGARLAEPGEFTLRAFLSGRIDLTRAEAVLGVIDARTPAQLEAALEQLAGGLAGPILVLRDRLLDILAHLEANLDFAEESDVDPLGRAALADDLAGSAVEVAALAARLRGRDRPEGYPRVVLVGPPNAGKSRLFNALVGEPRALVSPQAGTTRDYLSALCDCGGPDRRADRHRRGRARASARSRPGRRPSAPSRRPAPTSGSSAIRSTPARATLGRARARSPPRLATKCDLAPPAPSSESLPTSAQTGAGLGELRAAIAAALQERASDGESTTGTGARCRESLALASQALHAASETLLERGGDELVALDLRQAVDELGKVVGAVVTDDILDRIFRRFCIGK